MKTTNQSDTSNHKPLTVDDIIRSIQEKSADGNYIFRGEPKCYQRVSSNLFRELEAIKVKFSDIKEIEAGIIAEAKSYTDKTDDSEIRDDIQHYGGKTNSIDFTTDYNVALFFACYGLPTKSGQVIILQETEKIKEMLRYPKTPEIRVGAQKSVFVEPTKGYIEEKFEVICIPKELKLLILQHLKENLNPEITPKTIYNDIHGFIRSQNTYWMVYRDFYNGLISQNKAKEAKTLKEKQKAFKEVIEHYTNALDKDLQLASVYNNRGNAYNNINEYDSAIADFDIAIQLEPNSAEAYHNRGNTYGKNGELDLALADFNKAMQIKPDDAETYSNQGNVHYRKREYDRAIIDYNKAIKLKPDYPEAYNNRGVAYREKGEFNLALENFNRAIELEPNYAEAHNNRGNAYDKKNDVDRAIIDYNKAIELIPDYAEAHYNRGIAHLHKRKFDLAIKDFSKTIEIKPDDVLAYNNRGMVYFRIDEFDLAIEDFTKGIELGHLYAPIYYNRAVAYGKKGEYTLSIKDYEMAIKLKGIPVQVYYNCGEAWLHLREWEKAKADLITAKEMGVDIVAAFRNDYESVADFEQKTGKCYRF